MTQHQESSVSKITFLLKYQSVAGVISKKNDVIGCQSLIKHFLFFFWVLFSFLLYIPLSKIHTSLKINNEVGECTASNFLAAECYLKYLFCVNFKPLSLQNSRQKLSLVNTRTLKS